MDKKIDLDTLKEILRDHVEDTTQAQILKEINQVLIEKEEVKEKDKPEKIEKKSIVILTSLPTGTNPKDLESVTGFYTEIPLEDHIGNTAEKLKNAQSTYHQSKKGKKNPAKTIGDLLEFASSKTLKGEGIHKKPKGALEFVYIPNKF